MPKRTSAGASVETQATIAIGITETRIPRAKPVASRRLEAMTATTNAPTMLPTPIAVLSQPTPALPAWSRLMASTTSSTSSAPDVRVWAPVRPTMTLSAGCRITVEKPAVSSGQRLGRSVRSGGLSWGTWTTKAADQTRTAPLKAKTAAGPLSASSTPPSAGPANIPTLAMVLLTTLAAVSSSGVSTSDGRSAP
jgi:hypothetical protein